MTSSRLPIEPVHLALKALQQRMQEVIRGKSEVIEHVLVALLAGGHVLIEDLPGMGKTTLAYALARALDGRFQRIQFTSDLLPSDVLGVSVYNENTRQFEFRKGPVFAHFLLADEINRTTPKTQSALLEVMDRGRVSMDGQTYPVGAPFMVFATQNPVDYEGTFPLPDSQMDRFCVSLQMGYPAYADELDILRSERRHYDDIVAEPIVSLADVLHWQDLVPRIFIEESVLRYLLNLVSATRSDSSLRNGISPRGALVLKFASQARALLHGRDYVLPADVRQQLLPVCRHRMALASPLGDASQERRRIEAILSHLLETVALPQI